MTPTTDKAWTVKETHRNVHCIDVEFDAYRLGGAPEFRVLLSADRHFDNPHSDLTMQRRHLAEAERIGAPVVDLGDFFDAMQGKGDRRHQKGDLKPEFTRNDYLDALVEEGQSFLHPFASALAVFGEGNHDSAIRKHHETDLMNRLVYRMNREHEDAKLFRGGYSGWVQFRFRFATTKVQTINLFYHHGYGGGGPVTKGVIQTNRRAVYLPDAHIVATGHVHESWTVEQPRARITHRGKPYQDVQMHVQVPPYKEEYEDGYGGFHVEKGRPPKPVGATWLVFTRDKKQVFYDSRRAR